MLGHASSKELDDTLSSDIWVHQLVDDFPQRKHVFTKMKSTKMRFQLGVDIQMLH